jgi:hypothetical protein
MSRVTGGRFCALAPDSRRAASIEVDGHPASVTMDRVGADTYACHDTSWGARRIEIVWR